MSGERIEIQKGSGNIFKDLAISNPEEHLTKVRLVFTIEDLITESGLGLKKVAKILDLSPAKLSTLLDGLLDDFSVDYLSSVITKLKVLTADSAVGPIDRFFQRGRQVSHSLFQSPLAVGTTGFGMLVLIIGGFYLGNRYFDEGISDTKSSTGIARENRVVPMVQVKPTFVKGVGKDITISRFGFGMLPEIPSDFPDQNIWNVVEKRSVHDPDGAKTLELLARVRIKLWEKGEHTKGVIMDPSSGLVYSDSDIKVLFPESPDFPKYDTYFDEDFMSSEGIIVKFLEGGIDPYEFLNLPR